MKNHILAFFIILFTSTTGWGQKYYLNNGFTDGATVTTCAGTFYDSNPIDNYKPNENYSVTFSSGNPNRVIRIVLSTISLGAGDTLFSYDGNSIHAPVIDTFTNNTQNLVSFTASANNTSGCITFKFVSDAENKRSGWEGEISCIFPCKQRINSTTYSFPAQDASGYTDICFHDSVSFFATGRYPDDNLVYHQADSSSTFHWFFGDGTDTTAVNLQSVKHLYNVAGGFYARLTITDSNGCENNQLIRFPVRTSLRPVFNINPPPSICLFDTAVVKPAAVINNQGTVTSLSGSFVTFPVSGDSVFLPDDPPKCHSSSVVIEQFSPHQTLKSIDDIEGIFMNMEHSYLGDLTISIEAPNGVRVFLKSTVEGSAGDGTFLGEPVDESLNGNPTDISLSLIRGNGYDYVFNSTPKYGTMWGEVSKYTYSYTDNAGQVVTDHFYLPAGSYQSEESLLPLIGTPLNGKWTLEICDKQAVDNGYLFDWGITFKKSLYPNAETYTPPIQTQAWKPATGIVGTNATTAFISPRSPGTFAYAYLVHDQYGCNYDSTIKLLVNPIPVKPNLGADTTICTGLHTPINLLNADNSNTYNWSTKQKGVSNISVSEAGSYWVEAVNNKGCKNRDTIVVQHINPFTVSVGSDTLYCSTRPNNTLTASASTTIVGWNWSNGSTLPTYNASSTGTYWVEGKDSKGCVVRDTVHITENPVNNLQLPNDTSICANSPYTLTLSPAAGITVVWNDSSTSYAHSINKAGLYSITASFNGCIHQSKMNVNFRPVPIFTLGKDTTMCSGYDLPLYASYPGATYRWSSGSTDSVFIASRSGIYWAEATLNGCSFRDSVTMQQKLCACQIKMPNAFSPNGDGINDVYKPTIKCFPRDYHLTIFNRDGQIVFDTRNYQNLWDGKFNGTLLPVATYYYILTLFNEDLMQNEKTSGSITLIR